jgi:hypothetical protein
MTNKAAQAIARCISVIAQDSAKIAVIDQEQRASGINAFNSQARVSLVENIERHEKYLAQRLQQESKTENDK